MIDFDVETTGLQPYSEGNEAFLWIFEDDDGKRDAIPFSPSGQEIETWNVRPDPRVWEAAENCNAMSDASRAENRIRIQQWFDRGKVEGIRAWNAKFDRAFAEAAKHFDVPGDGMWYDGMLVAQAIDERRSVALKAVAVQLFGDDADDAQKKLKAWLNAENSRRSKVLKDAEKAASGSLRIKYVEDVPCPRCDGAKVISSEDIKKDVGGQLGGEVCLACDGTGLKTTRNRTRKATDEECSAVIAEAQELLDPKTGDYRRANYSHVPREIMEPYALEDVILTRKISNVYDARLQDKKDLRGLIEFERKAMDALYAVEKRGLPARDVEYRKLEQEVIANLADLEDRVMDLVREANPIIYAKELAGDNWGEDGHWIELSEDGHIRSYRGGAAMLEDFKPNSTAQVLAALKARGADLSYMSVKDGKVSADADNLRAVDDELAVAILNFRAEYKVLSTYVRPMIGRSYVSSMNVYKEPFIAPDSRIHANYRQVGARTGRMSCSDPNMQNQPRDDLRLRYNIVAEPGFALVTCDLTNIEMVLFAAYCGEGRLLDAVRNGDDLHVLTAKMLGLRDRARPGGGVETARQLGKVYNFCVPLETQILTRRGWLNHDQVRVGDETIGYDAGSRTSRWTRINGVHVFGESPLVRLSSGSWAATCTPQHRWITEKMRRPELQSLKSADQLNSEDRLMLAAPLASDAHASLPDLSAMRRDGDWTARVLAMSSEQRRAWLAGFALGEGSLTGNTWSVFQNTGDLADAAELAVYLEGYRPSTGVHHFKGGTVPHMRVRACKPNVTGQKLVREDAGAAPVWCVSTDLNTWTMRERGGSPMLTGNTTIYGGGLRSIRRYFRCSLDEARLYKQRYANAYPEVTSLQYRIECRLEDDGYIQDKLISGRRFRVDPRDSYKATNYLVQGTAAALLKDAVISLHADGVPMVALVHDEILAHVPIDEAPDVARLIEKRMTQAASPGGQLWLPDKNAPVVPLRAEADIVERWSDAKPLKDDDGRPYLFTPQWAGGEKRYLKEAA